MRSCVAILGTVVLRVGLSGPAGVPASASTIDFSGLVPGSPFTIYASSGFTASPTSGSWSVNAYGAPGPSIVFFSEVGQPITTAQIQITTIGLPFTFSSVDLYSSVTPIPYEFTGLLGGSTVFTEVGTVPNTFGSFMTVHVGSVGIIDTLLITLSNPIPGFPAFSNPMGLDNVVVNHEPPPPPPPIGTIPTLSESGQIIMIILLIVCALWTLRRRRGRIGAA